MSFARSHSTSTEAFLAFYCHYKTTQAEAQKLPTDFNSHRAVAARLRKTFRRPFPRAKRHSWFPLKVAQLFRVYSTDIRRKIFAKTYCRRQDSNSRLLVISPTHYQLGYTTLSSILLLEYRLCNL